jgi:hypothetical protein
VMFKSAISTRKLVPSFSSTADANVSFDGKRVLFAGKHKASDHWQVWELVLESGKLRQITSSPDDAVRPMYLPEDRVAYAQKKGGRFVLEAVALGGGTPLALFHAPGSAIPTDVLLDGRILFDASFPLGKTGHPEIYTVYSDGSGVESYRCDHGATRYAGRQLASGDILFTHGNSLARFTSALANEVAVQSPAGEYAGDVLESAPGEWIIPFKARAAGAYYLISWRGGASQSQVIAQDAGVNILQPAFLAARPVPNRHPSGLHDWKTANLLALNSHVTRKGVTESEIASVRLYTADEHGRTIVLGAAPVEQDGSFYVMVPGDRPLKFELLDSAGKALSHEAGWMWARAGEQRICVGCHAGPEHAPENAGPQVLLRSTTPVDLSSSHRVTGKRGQ